MDKQEAGDESPPTYADALVLLESTFSQDPPPPYPPPESQQFHPAQASIG